MTGISRDHEREEVAALVCEALDRAGIPVVLSGGAVVSIYSDNAYESMDLDFVRQGIARKVDGTMVDTAVVVAPETASCDSDPSALPWRGACRRKRKRLRSKAW